MWPSLLMEDRVWSFRNVSSIWRELEVETWDVLPSVRISLFLARFEHGSCEERDRVILGLLGGVWKICYFTHTWGNHPIWQTCVGKSSNLTSISISFKYLKHLKPATSKSASSDSLGDGKVMLTALGPQEMDEDERIGLQDERALGTFQNT